MLIVLTALDRRLTVMKIHTDSQCSACEEWGEDITSLCGKKLCQHVEAYVMELEKLRQVKPEILNIQFRHFCSGLTDHGTSW